MKRSPSIHFITYALLFTSIWEGPLPYVVMESMLARTLPISSKVGGVPEIVQWATQVTGSNVKSWNGTFYYDNPLHDEFIRTENVSLPPGFSLLNINPKSGRWFCSDGHGILWFSDNQIEWQKSKLHVSWISFTPSGDVTFTLSQEKYLYRSTDNGQNWSLVLNSSVYTGLERQFVKLGVWGFKSPYLCGAYNDSLIFIGEYGSSPSPYPEPVYVYRSTDGGKSWTVVLNVTQFMENWWWTNKNESYYPNHNTTHVHFVAANPFTGKIYVSKGDYLGGAKSDLGLVIFSDDFGQTWKTLYLGQPTAIAFLKDKVIFGEDWHGTPYTVYVESEGKLSRPGTNMTMFDYVFSMVEVNGVIYSGQVSRGEGKGWGGIWISSDGSKWYWSYKPRKLWSTVTVICTDGKYVYFLDSSDNSLHRMKVMRINDVISLTNQYPLEFRFPVIFDGVTYIVQIDTNSTVSAFTFNQPNRTISFNVTGSSGTWGFCNVTIPHVLLGSYTVRLDGSAITPPTARHNATHSFLYFTYMHGTHHVEIVGSTVMLEFYSTMVVLTSFIVLVLIIIYVRKKMGETHSEKLCNILCHNGS